MCKYCTFLFHHVLLNPSFLSFLYGGHHSYFNRKSGGEPQREGPFALHYAAQSQKRSLDLKVWQVGGFIFMWFGDSLLAVILDQFDLTDYKEYSL